MRKIVAAVHGILTGQTEASWPDKLDAWIFARDPEIKVLKKEYRAGPFPRWNCWVKDPFLAHALANELTLFFEGPPDEQPELWFVAHSNGAVIALLTAGLLIERGFKIEGMILTGAACEADIARNHIMEWQSRGMLGKALAYCSKDDAVLPLNECLFPEEQVSGFSRIKQWFWGKLAWPYGALGRTGWLRNGEVLPGQFLSTLQSRWFAGGHATYFTPQNITKTFKQIYKDISEKADTKA